MEDKHIFNGEICYQFRIDISHNDQNEKSLQVILKQYFTRCAAARENKKDGASHYQCILWRNTTIPKKDEKYLRTFLKQNFKFTTKTNVLSFTSARRIKSLACYCNNKEEKGIFSFGINDLTVLGKWVNPIDKKEKLKEKLIKKLKQINDEEIISLYKLCEIACQVYKDQRPPPFKSLLQYGRSAGYLPQKVFINEYYRQSNMSVYNRSNYEIPAYSPLENNMENYIISDD